MLLRRAGAVTAATTGSMGSAGIVAAGCLVAMVRGGVEGGVAMASALMTVTAITRAGRAAIERLALATAAMAGGRKPVRRLPDLSRRRPPAVEAGVVAGPIAGADPGHGQSLPALHGAAGEAPRRRPDRDGHPAGLGGGAVSLPGDLATMRLGDDGHVGAAGDVLGVAGIAQRMIGAVGVVDLAIDAGGFGGTPETLRRPVGLLGSQMLLVIVAPGRLVIFQAAPAPKV